MQPTWIYETTVRSFETDFAERWKPACFFQAMQEAATGHAAHLGFGYREMMANNKIWILSRMKICFEDFPRLGEQVIFETWPKGLQQKLFFMRDFDIRAGDGRRLALASSAWLLVNPTARRLLMPNMLDGELPDNQGRFALDEIVDRLSPPEDMPEQRVVEATFSTVDMMGHVNNARYVEWITDSFTLDDYRQRSLKWIQVNYSNEVRPGDRVSICAAPKADAPDAWLVQGANLTSGAKAFEAEIGWG